jgi:hypothetical protein
MMTMFSWNTQFNIHERLKNTVNVHWQQKKIVMIIYTIYQDVKLITSCTLMEMHVIEEIYNSVIWFIKEVMKI